MRMLVVIPLLVGISFIALGADEKEQNKGKNPTVNVILDQSIKSQGVELGAAWFGYAYARKTWINDNILSGDRGDPRLYRRSFPEELAGREALARIWTGFKKKGHAVPDEYLDELVVVNDSGFMREYVWRHLAEATWEGMPEGLRLEEFDRWAERNLAGHKVETFADVKIEDE